MKLKITLYTYYYYHHCRHNDHSNHSEAMQTELLASSVVEDDFVGRVQTNAPHNVAYLGAVHHAVSTVPEVEQIKHVPHVWQTHTSSELEDCVVWNKTI